ncbi:hypothetical protein CVT26_007464 [Gymnopilus dilepis]|uniref:Uncharacterized protein n=1 Tax=Gymnopilus dilepis TaxID=231916 RepID=A0A409W7V3_9AGAR|nr:hypothetical protein CVT26_007464 [Gymnopilus dilepis]
MSSSNQDVPMAPPPGPLAALSSSSAVAGQKRRRSPRPGPEEAGPSSARAVIAPQPTPDSGTDLRPAQRQRLDPGQPSTGLTAPTTARRMRATERRPSDWHISRKDVPSAARKTKEALEVHIRALWCLPDQNAVPPQVSAEDRNTYAARFTSEANIRTSVQDSLNNSGEFMLAAEERFESLLSTLSESSKISANIRRIPKPLLLLAFRSIAFFGLLRWAPDVLSKDPESLYNLLHEHIALKTFEQIAGAYGYSHIGTNLTVIRDYALMRKFYRNFVFSYLQGIAKKEAKMPGAVELSHERENAVKRRNELAGKRDNKFVAEAFHADFIWSVKEPEGHSDDECVEITNASGEKEFVYEIAEVEGRSTKYTTFYHDVIDPRTRIEQRRRGQHKKQFRRRVVPEEARPSRFEGEPLPKKVFIDYFEPDFWNNFSIEDKARYIENGIYIGMPPANLCKRWQDVVEWKGLNRDQMKERYGDEVLREYTIPTVDELWQLQQNLVRREEEAQAARERQDEAEVRTQLGE